MKFGPEIIGARILSISNVSYFSNSSRVSSLLEEKKMRIYPAQLNFIYGPVKGTFLFASIYPHHQYSIMSPPMPTLFLYVQFQPSSICMASVPVCSILSPNVTPYVHTSTLNAIANLTCMASGGVCSLIFTDRGAEPKGMVS